MSRQCTEDALRRLAGRGTHDRPHDGKVIQNNSHTCFIKSLAQPPHETSGPTRAQGLLVLNSINFAAHQRSLPKFEGE